MEWSFGNTVMLAGIVKQYPILYDGTIHYRKRQFAWGLVAKRIGQEGNVTFDRSLPFV